MIFSEEVTCKVNKVLGVMGVSWQGGVRLLSEEPFDSAGVVVTFVSRSFEKKHITLFSNTTVITSLSSSSSSSSSPVTGTRVATPDDIYKEVVARFNVDL